MNTVKTGTLYKKNDRWYVTSSVEENLPLDSLDYKFAIENKIVKYEILQYHYVSGGLRKTGELGGKGLQHHTGNYAKLIDSA